MPRRRKKKLKKRHRSPQQHPDYSRSSWTVDTPPSTSSSAPIHPVGVTKNPHKSLSSSSAIAPASLLALTAGSTLRLIDIPSGHTARTYPGASRSPSVGTFWRCQRFVEPDNSSRAGQIALWSTFNSGLERRVISEDASMASSSTSHCIPNSNKDYFPDLRLRDPDDETSCLRSVWRGDWLEERVAAVGDRACLFIWKLDEDKSEFPDDPAESLDRASVDGPTKGQTRREREMSQASTKIPLCCTSLFCVLGVPLHKGGTSGHLYVSSSGTGVISLVDITKSEEVCRGKALTSVYGLLGHSAEHNVIVSGCHNFGGHMGEVHDAKTLKKIAGIETKRQIIATVMLTEHVFVLGGIYGEMAIGDLRKLGVTCSEFRADVSRESVWSLARTGNRSFASAQGPVVHWVLPSGSYEPKMQWVHKQDDIASGLSYLGPNPLIDPEGVALKFLLEQEAERMGFLFGNLDGGESVVCPNAEVCCRSKKIAVWVSLLVS